MQQLRYKGLRGSFRYFPKEDLFYGTIQNVKPKLSYEADTFEELFTSFQELIDECIQKGDVLLMLKKYNKMHWENNVKFVCERDHIPYTIKESSNDYVLVEIKAKINELEILEEDAMCEKQRNDAGSKIPVYSYNTLKNPQKKERLMKFYKRKGFVVYKPDKQKCSNECL